MKIISNQKRSVVYFDENNYIYIKEFKPKFINRLKFFLGLRKYPGINFYYISSELNKLNIATAEIVSYSKYSVTTRALSGISLDKYLKTTNDNCFILEKYINLVVTLLKNNIYCGDLAYDNFLVNGNQLIALDLEDYRKVKFFKRTTKEALRRLQGKIDKDIFEKINSFFVNKKS